MDTSTNLLDPIGLKRLFKEAAFEAIQEHEAKKDNQDPRLFSINAVAKIIGRSHKTVTTLVKSGTIKSTPDGLITETALNRYLGKD
ncbi:MAG: hypothetical protein NTW16_12880 [Bacteroidetes bacterium]|nr:hypothetical protein [Bacteroidota bacterium]